MVFTTYYGMGRIKPIGRALYVTLPKSYGFVPDEQVTVGLKKEDGTTAVIRARLVNAGGMAAFVVRKYIQEDFHVGDEVIFGIRRGSSYPEPLVWTPVEKLEAEDGNDER